MNGRLLRTTADRDRLNDERNRLREEAGCCVIKGLTLTAQRMNWLRRLLVTAPNESAGSLNARELAALTLTSWTIAVSTKAALLLFL